MARKQSYVRETRHATLAQLRRGGPHLFNPGLESERERRGSKEILGGRQRDTEGGDYKKADRKCMYCREMHM